MAGFFLRLPNSLSPFSLTVAAPAHEIFLFLVHWWGLIWGHWRPWQQKSQAALSSHLLPWQLWWHQPPPLPYPTPCLSLRGTGSQTSPLQGGAVCLSFQWSQARWPGLKTCFLPSQTFSGCLARDLEIHWCRVPSSCCCHLRQTVGVTNFPMQEVHKHECSSPRITTLIQTVIVSLGVYNCHLAFEWVHRQLLEWFVCRCYTLNGNQLHSQRFLNNATSHSEFLCSVSGTQMISELRYLLYISIRFLKTEFTVLFP